MLYEFISLAQPPSLFPLHLSVNGLVFAPLGYGKNPDFLKRNKFFENYIKISSYLKSHIKYPHSVNTDVCVCSVNADVYVCWMRYPHLVNTDVCVCSTNSEMLEAIIRYYICVFIEVFALILRITRNASTFCNTRCCTKGAQHPRHVTTEETKQIFVIGLDGWYDFTND